ncbi:MAG: hydrogenase formation protein HypD [Pseudomonadota bacterium]
MKYVDEFRSSDTAMALAASLRRRSTKPVRMMEFCGGHTVSVFRHGLRQLMPETVTLVSGPGCPVCVTANADLDRAVAFARVENAIVTTFGDMFRVPGSRQSLQQAKAEGADIRVVYSTTDALTIARANPGRPVIFLGIGFETTAPTVAASVVTAREQGLSNYFVHSMHKVCPPILEAILSSGTVNLQGLICPGHVSAITGAKIFAPVAGRWRIPCVVSGFEPADLLQAVDMLVAQVEAGESRVEIAYSRGVTWEGNVHAQRLLDRVFEPAPADWRGVGVVPDSGLRLREEFAAHDAEAAFDVDPGPTIEAAGCICGNVLLGTATPADCALFRSVCTPEAPVGPCMVSSEGSCSAWYKYGGR